ncbi:hypothetical protein [Aliirhizobium smilacinae]|uniref:Uncharacterized protein n=1 Tax=Aliirhizobium smilacinae TaxID=1395944 RepID=A0A5C4XP49_9HYPH|nr:hypothetical protein [Rhizobium smilacinae]TNM65316.1 hypothetical protein FHP24_03300 [Rhizobium smilacinae]
MDDRRDAVLAIYSRVTDFNYNAKVGPFQILAMTATQGCMHPRTTKYMSELVKIGPKGEGGPLAFEMFSLPPLVRYLYMYGNCLSPENVASIKKSITSSRVNLNAHGTLNHAIMQISSWYLIAQYFPDIIWTTSDGEQITSPEVMERLKDKLSARTESFYQNGYAEQSSPTYAMVNFFPLLNMIDFGRDAQLRQSSEREAILILALLKANSFHGRLVPPLTRHTHPQTIAQDARALAAIPAVTQHVLWFYFGEPQYGRFDLQNKREPYYVAMLALSKWSAPFSAAVFTQPYVATINTPAFAIWGNPTSREIYGRHFMAENFVIGGGNSVLEPGGYNEDTDAFGIIYRTQKSFGLIDCYHPYYRSNSGDLAWESDRSSPFQEIYIGGSSGLLIFDIPDADPYIFDAKNSFYMKRNNNAASLFKVVNCRFPTLGGILEVDGSTIYYRDGNIYVALKAENGFFESRKSRNPEMIGYQNLSIKGARNAIYFTVAEAAKYGSLEAFKEYISSKMIVKTPQGYSYNDDGGDNIEVRYSAQPVDNNRMRLIPEVLKNGTRIDGGDAAVVKSPSITLEDGRLTLRCNGSEDVVLRTGVDVPRFPKPCRL